MLKRFPIKAKLTFGALAPLFVAFFICSLAGLYIINEKIASQAQEKVRTDLNSAREVYRNELDRIREFIDLTATNPYNSSSIVAGDHEIQALLRQRLYKKRLDILTAVDAKGRVLYRAHTPSLAGDLQKSYFVQQALKGVAVTGTALMGEQELAREGVALSSRATIPLVSTPHARPRNDAIEKTGMVMVSAAPLRNHAGQIIGALYGAVLLNNNNALVDKIKEIVYEGVQFNGTDVGSATIFLGDARIATNVRLTDGARAIGTRVSEEVYQRVIVEKKKWIRRAFVVNDWYFTAYEPILDLHGKAIGSLYVGMLEKPYTHMQKSVNSILYMVLFVTSLIGLAVSGFIATLLARPIKELEKLAHRVARGERNLQMEVHTKDEVGDLADAFNLMTRALSRQEAEIGLLHRALELKVEERTAQLSDKNRLLLQTQADLARAEKLADLGIVAAGVAHEINTPLAIIRGNAEVLEMCLPPEHPNHEEVEIISMQTERMAKIVGNLLTFARQKSLNQREFMVHEILDDIVTQIRHQVPMDAISVQWEYDMNLGAVTGDTDQLRQVFSNIILNAVQAMLPEGGTLRLTTRPHGPGNGCEVEIRDTGKGIPAEHLEKIFTPFFTTRDSGTGLGLSVSYGIVRDHGGDIQVSSTPGAGTCFKIVLPGETETAQETPENVADL
ncbi:sensor histidine kinase, HAMP domain-containing [Citrifermentans bemidjiense Bem]|uniref:histidine kinase n=1 Tax=Citrifermentans bemidjiense (strain ATCC BAA-1014 / DSM 16622 / JCM 12645 / Bem) TaxID=404380 RepID=B5EEA7_CITBB|nr:cache domain-containing protein [Citrifermentans bemidjiense]ACH39252.1 sensor histidine kinase, HAMP domain-containing [Citrifermentans bemidjiense Bem]